MVEHLSEGPLEINRLRRGALHGVLDPADDALDRSEQSGMAPAGLEQGSHQEGRGCLAVGAGDPDGLQLRGRVAVESRRRRRHRRPHRGHANLRHVET